MKALLIRIRILLRSRRNRQLLTRAVSVIAAIVVFVTTYALVLPAITLEQEAFCGILEHQHTDTCYEERLVCEIPEGEDHHHDASCYEKVLVCGQEVHIHSPECYQEDSIAVVSAGSETAAFTDFGTSAEADEIFTEADQTSAEPDEIFTEADQTSAEPNETFPETDRTFMDSDLYSGDGSDYDADTIAADSYAAAAEAEDGMEGSAQETVSDDFGNASDSPEDMDQENPAGAGGFELTEDSSQNTADSDMEAIETGSSEDTDAGTVDADSMDAEDLEASDIEISENMEADIEDLEEAESQNIEENRDAVYDEEDGSQGESVIDENENQFTESENSSDFSSDVNDWSDSAADTSDPAPEEDISDEDGESNESNDFAADTAEAGLEDEDTAVWETEGAGSADIAAEDADTAALETEDAGSANIATEDADIAAGETENEGSADTETADADTAAGLEETANEAATDVPAEPVETEKLSSGYVPQLDSIDFGSMLNKHTDFYYFHAEEGQEIPATSAEVTDWKKVKNGLFGSTKLETDDLVKAYFSYTIPAGALNETNQVARYRLPSNIHLTDDQIIAINGTENGMTALYADAAAIEDQKTADDADDQTHTEEAETDSITGSSPEDSGVASGTDEMDEENEADEADEAESAADSLDPAQDENAANYQKYLGAEAVEGTRTPDEKLKEGAQEYISAIVKVENVFDDEGLYGEKGAYLGQDLIFIFTPYSIEKNQTTYDADGNPVSAGEKITGWFACDFNMSQIDWVEEDTDLDKSTVEKTAEVVFVEKDSDNNVKEISRTLKLVDKTGDQSDSAEGGKTVAAAETAAVAETAAAAETTAAAETAGTAATAATAAETAATASETAATDEAAEDTEAGSFKSGTLTADGDGYKITLDYTEEAKIPENAELSVREITAETDREAYEACLEQAGQQVAADDKTSVDRKASRFFDIEILVKETDSEGREETRKIEPSASVSVNIQIIDAPAAEDAASGDEKTERNDPAVLHFAEEGVEQIDSTVKTSQEQDSNEVRSGSEETEPATEISFEAESFSIYGVVYTVDFSYSVNGRVYEFSLSGGGKIALSELIEALGILEDAFDDVDSFLMEVANVTFSDDSLVRVTKDPTGYDWTLESLQPFSTDEELTITMKNRDVITVQVTDAVYQDITSLLSSVTISGATQNPDGSYNVFPGSPYIVELKFDETPQDTFDRTGPVTYRLPAGVRVPTAGSGTLVPSDPSQAEIYTINYTIGTDGTITFNWDVKPGKEQDFLDLPGMFIGLTMEIEFDESASIIDWHGEAQVTVDRTHDLGVQKSATLHSDGYMYYAVTVTSTGDNTNISLTDTISGTALTLDGSSIAETTNHGATFSNITDKGFNITIPELKNGESATITYRAQVDYDVLASEAGVEKGKYGSVTTTGNRIQINGADDNPDNDTAETHVDHSINFSSAGKRATAGDYDEETGKRTMHWQIWANDEHRTAITYIHDAMGDGADKMNYSGDGITVQVINTDWSVAAEYTVPWSQLGVGSGSTEWTYHIPDQYKSSDYSFVIDYTTEVDVSDAIVPVDVKNDVETDYGQGGGSGEADPAPGSKLDMEKSVAEANIPGGTVTWTITVDVPETGLDSCVVTDILPTVNGPERFTDGFDSSSFNAARDVTGLIDGETVSLDATSQPGSVIFTFHKNGQPGLYPVEGGRQIAITLTTTLDEDWMAFEITGDHLRYYNTHTNTARVVANNYTIEDSAHITVNNTDPSMLKRMDEYMEDSFHWQTWDAGNNLKAWMYRLYLYGVSDDMFTDGYLEITDTFDDRYLAYYDPDNANIFTNNGQIARFHQKLTHGSENGNYSDPTDIEATVSGGTITFRIPQSAFLLESGGYDRFYHISYFLHVRDNTTTRQMDEDALAAGGTLKIKNTAVWAYSEPTEVEIEHDIPIIDKSYIAIDEAAGVYQFEIKINEGGHQLGDEEFLEVTDSYTNLTIDYSTLTCDPEDALLSYTHSGNTVKYYVRNGVPVTLRYTASALESGPFSNTVEVNAQSVTKTGTAHITSRGSTGAREASIKVLKHSGTNLLDTIDGVQFELYEYDESYPNNYNPDAPVLHSPYTTGANGNGLFTIQHIPLTVENGEYTTHSKKYVLHEVEPPEGYKPMSHDYYFVVDTQTAIYGEYIYLNDDTLPISNKPVEEDEISITVVKIWPDDEADLPELIRVRLYQKDSRTAPAASAIEVDVAEMTRGTDGSWTHTFTGLDPEKAYFIKEDPVEGYTASYSSNNILGLEQSGTINITNTKDEPDDETASITVKKKWMQGEEEITDIEQKKDLSATVELVRYRTPKSTTAVHFYHVGNSGWTKISDETIPQGTGVEFSYTASASYAGGMGVFSSIDTTKAAHESQGTSLISGKPGQANGSSQTITVNSEGYDDLYVVWQYNSAPTISGFEVVNEGTGSSGVDVTATIDPTYTNPETITLNRENGWRASFSNLPTSGTGSDDGKAYSYTYGIRETATSDSSFAFESYSVDTYDGEGSNNATAAVASGSTVTVTNKKEAPQTGSLKLTKVVQVDGDTPSTDAEKNLVNGDYVFTVSSGNSIVKYVQITVTNGIPASYKIADTKDALESATAVQEPAAILSGLDEGDYVITEIEKNGMTLKEAARGDNDTDAVSEDNAVTVHVTAGENEPEDSSAAAATFTNNIETVTAKVVKVWDHTGNTGAHPGSLNVTLSNGETYELNAGNNWIAEVTDLPKYDRTTGSLIEYNWTEAELPAGYYLSNIQESTDETTGVITTTLTNSYTDSYNPTTTISGKKVWDDGGVNRPKSITVNLYKDGDTTTPYRTSTVQAPTGEGADQDQWPFEFTNLPVFNSDGSVIQYTVGEVLPAGYTEEYGIKIEFTQATYIAGDTTGVIVNSGQGDQTFKITDGYNLGYIVIRHGNDFIIWTPRPATADEISAIKTKVVGLSDQFNGINSASGDSMKIVSGVPGTVDVGKKHAVSVYMQNGEVWMKFLNPNAWSDFAYGTIPYTYTQAGGEGGGTITNTKKNTELEFGKKWIDIGQQEINWDRDIQVTVNRTKTDGNKDDSFSLVYQITKNAVENATGGTVEFAANNATDTTPKLKLTITTEGDKKKYTFKIENLAYSSETDGKYTYYVEETNQQLEGYLEPSYWNTGAPTGGTAAYDDGIIINKQEGGYELPSTGGPGTRLFTILGSILILGAGLLLWRRRRLI